MAAAKAEMLFSEPLACAPTPLSPLDGYSKLEELQMLLQNAAAGGSLLAAEAAGLLSGECAEFGGEDRACGTLEHRCMVTLLETAFMQNAGFCSVSEMISCIGGGFKTGLNRTSVKKNYFCVMIPTREQQMVGI